MLLAQGVTVNEIGIWAVFVFGIALIVGLVLTARWILDDQEH